MQSISHNELKSMLDNHEDITMINVLSHQNFEKEHIPDSINVPVETENFSEKVAQQVGGKDEKLVVYCQNESCDASTKAAKKLEAANFEQVLCYEGGIEEWKNQGYPVEGNA